MNDPRLKAIADLISDPIFLFFVMIAVQAISIVGQWWEARRNGSTMTFMELLSYWPQLVSGFGLSVGSFFTLVETDTLNLASAIGISGVVNKFSDLLSSRRSKAITDSIPADVDHGARK